ncbi:MAG: hypothetical protein A3C07_04610 [Candidatus Sungbacteria bacterium RIFCSPHIGHO2_02_FULL_47_11]|uniref:Hemerythrin-like domain-containing protein n=1 Tax=Candidatus Sungbacteria bacterium RIFCSPHIGHO2_02_FULL_47_11 TaxID=1802270 RepID=A0A1G2KH22_9BACT|nr:MAG: hypothetical protein A3C07_04610 [Candidatus Sungbacteria bacterium RIFCSPHIGHO2_02_FULL_47_11]
MKSKIVPLGQGRFFAQFLRNEKKVVLKNLDQLEKALYSLQYESKISSSEHIKKAEEVMLFLKNKYTAHIKLDDRIIFPFLEKHVPRLTPILLYLKAERGEFQEELKVFEKTLLELKRDNKGALRYGIIERLKDKGIYLICLIRSHIQLEEQGVYESLTRGLKPAERSDLLAQIIRYSSAVSLEKK